MMRKLHNWRRLMFGPAGGFYVHDPTQLDGAGLWAVSCVTNGRTQWAGITFAVKFPRSEVERLLKVPDWRGAWIYTENEWQAMKADELAWNQEKKL